MLVVSTFVSLFSLKISLSTALPDNINAVITYISGLFVLTHGMCKFEEPVLAGVLTWLKWLRGIMHYPKYIICLIFGIRANIRLNVNISY